MRNIVTAIQQRDGRSLQQIYGQDKPKQQVTEQAVQIFNELFRQLKGAFPALMANIKSQEDLNELRRQWVMAFAENGIHSIAQVNAGMKIARQQPTPFLPSPGQFIAWCNEGASTAAGLPDEDALYAMVMTYSAKRGFYDNAEDYPWQSNAAYWMVTGLFSMMRGQNLTEKELRAKCRSELRSMTSRIQSGEDIPPPRKTIPKLYRPVGNEKGLDKIAEIRQKLGMRKS
ncbi:DNA replication protein [Izhakiella australiensis]|uniref:DNA replication protein n=1 Tax=Izhakiella australiensis TaxID=1926881 RepID=A0A1S8Y9V8_9GAMM|nr:replication protein P [Izhakiella australiensis]OON35632.1 DNA replication protein [Izhakiella australiensis]